MRPKRNSKISIYFSLKRIVDFVLSFILIVGISPVIIILFLVIWLKIGWPVFFTQLRPGKHGKAFKIIKFRTMVNAYDPQGNLLPDNLRTPGIGRLFRRTSLDELPEFLNVLKGDMSLVGPRPLLMKYMPFFTEREQKRHNVKPGITGLSQVNGRNLLTWDQRLEMDVQYVENSSIILDIKILLLTIRDVIFQRGVLEVSSEQIPDFDDFRKRQTE